jgi:hypothetical protein
MGYSRAHFKDYMRCYVRLFMHVISYVLKVSTIEEVVLVLITTPSSKKNTILVFREVKQFEL